MPSILSVNQAPKEQDWLWRGRDRRGQPVSGDLRATSPAQVIISLRRQGILATRVRRRPMERARRISRKDITVFTRQLATMMRAGVPLIQAFEIVGKGAGNRSMLRLITSLRADLESGAALAQAFQKHPKYFDNLYCSVVAAGETAGILDSLLDRLAVYQERMLAIRGRIATALFYPTAVMLVALIVVSVILVFVIPAFKNVFSGFGAELPTATLMVIALSDWFAKWWLVCLAILGTGSWIATRAVRRSPRLRAMLERNMLRLPIFGPILRSASIARWARTLSMMFSAGVPLYESLDSVGGASGNIVYKEATRQIQTAVAGGTSLMQSMQNSIVFPNLVVQMAAIGEESGALDTMLGKAADIYEREVEEAVDGLTSLLEPLIMVVLGTLIGGLVVAMYLPLFKLGQVV